MEAVIIQRVASESLRLAMQENKITILQGIRGSGKKDAVINQLEALKASFISYSPANYKAKEEGELGWEQLLHPMEKVDYLIFDQAEYLDNWTLLLETILADDAVKNVVLISSFLTNYDEAYALALENADAIIHWTAPSFGEIAQELGMGAIEQKLEELLVYGHLEQVMDADQKKIQLTEILDYWKKGQWSNDDRINKRDQQLKVLKTLAFQMGDIVSYNEIAIKCGLDNETVERYVQLFARAFLIQIVPNFSTGQKYEMKKGLSIYFTDNGIRNALIENFTEMDWRMDADQLWRNWLVMERQKMIQQRQLSNRLFTWRSLTKTVVDIVEQSESGMLAYQVIWNKKEKKKFPAGFKNYYEQAKTTTLNRATYWSFLTSKK